MTGLQAVYIFLCALAGLAGASRFDPDKRFWGLGECLLLSGIIYALLSFGYLMAERFG